MKRILSLPYSFYSFLSNKDISRVFQSRPFKIFDSLIYTNWVIKSARKLCTMKHSRVKLLHFNSLWLETLVLDAYCIHVKDYCVSQAMAMSSDPRAEKHLGVGNLILFKPPRSRFPSARTLRKRAVVFSKRTRYINWQF